METMYLRNVGHNLSGYTQYVFSVENCYKVKQRKIMAGWAWTI